MAASPVSADRRTADAAPRTPSPRAPSPLGRVPEEGPSVLATARTMVGLKARLTGATLRRSTWTLVGTILGLAWLLGMIALWGALGWFYGSSAAPEQAMVPAVLIGSAATLGWWLVSIVTGRADATLHSSRFAPYPVPRRGVALGQLLGGLVGIGGPLTLLGLLVAAGLWSAEPVSLVAAVAMAPAGWLLMMLGNRCLSAALEGLQRRRRVGELISVLMLAAVVLAAPLLVGALAWLSSGGLRLAQAAEVLAWTPWGAPWAVPGDLALGDPGAAVGRCAVILAAMLVLWLVWDRLLARAGQNVSAPAAGGGRVRGAGLFDRFARSPFSAVAVRSTLYWLKDPRYAASLVLIPVVLAGFWVMSAVSGGAGSGGGLLVVAAPFVAVMLSYSISADIAYDHSAFSLHLLTGVRGRDDRAGRVLGMLVIGLPLTILCLLGAAALTDTWSLVPGMAGASLLALLGGAGVSSVLSARYTYPVPLPGDSPMKTPQGYTVLNVALQFAVMILIVVLTLPAVIPLVLQVITGQLLWGWIGLAAGLVLAPVLCWTGIVLGGRWLEARGPELLQQVSSYRS